MAKKSKAEKRKEVEEEILKEVKQEIKTEKPEKKKGKFLEKIKKDLGKKSEKKEEPKAEAPTTPPSTTPQPPTLESPTPEEAEPDEEKPKGKGLKPRKAEGAKKGLPKSLGEAVETIKGVRKGKEETEKPKLVGPAKLYTVKIPKSGARPGRTRRATHYLQNFAQKHSKKSDILIGAEVNEAMWKYGAKKHPNKLRITMQEDEEGRVLVNLK